MMRTQVNLEKDEYDLRKSPGWVLGISVAEFIRRAIREQPAVPHETPLCTFAQGRRISLFQGSEIR